MLRFIVKNIELLLISGLILLAAVQYYVRPQSQSYDEIQQSGVLRALITDEPDAQFVFNKQRYGFEYELLATFADSMGVALELIVVPFGELYTMLDNGAGDIAVGGIIDSPFVRTVGKTSLPWYQSKTTVVFQRGTKRPRKLQAFEGKPIYASARYYKIPGFDYLNLTDDYHSEYDLFNAVATGKYRFAFTTEYRAKNAQHYLPDLNRSFTMPDKVDLVWLLPKRYDEKLYEVLNAYLKTAMDKNLPNKLADYYLGLPKKLSKFDVLYFHKKISDTLPDFESQFRTAARKNNIDWQLLAAMAYQESHWSNDAESITGVRGIMQLTSKTADFLGVKDRMEIQESIQAAARYIAFLKSRIPERIKEPERTWFAVGAYNCGLKHILYAYKKASRLGLQRDHWNTVSQLLPNLYDEPFAQGKQAKLYVERVQVFTDILRFYDIHQRD